MYGHNIKKKKIAIQSRPGAAAVGVDAVGHFVDEWKIFFQHRAQT